MVNDKPKTKLHIKTKKLASLQVLTVFDKKNITYKEEGLFKRKKTN